MRQYSLSFLIVVLMGMFGVKIFAHDIEVENSDGVTIYYKWRNNKTELQVTYRGSSWDSYYGEYLGEIVIPESVTYEGVDYPVTSVEGWTFYMSSAESVRFPNSITQMEPFVFHTCSSLLSVTLPNGLTSIPSNMFSACFRLTSLEIPNSVTSIDDNAFKDCCSLSSITIPDGVTSIGNYAFSGCTALASLSIPSSVTTFGNYVFKDCTGLVSLMLDCREIRTWFKGRTSIQEITIGSGVTSIADGAFSGCNGLKSVTLHCPEVGSWFSGIPSITEVVLGEEVISIGDCAFNGCSGLTSLDIPDGVTSIGEAAFYDCGSLTSLTIPNSVTSVGDAAFEGCGSLASLTVLCKEIGPWFQNLTSLKEVYFGEDVTAIGSAFYGCSSLTSVYLPDGITSIGEAAFYECRSLASLSLPGSVTSIGAYAFYGCTSLCTITIPTRVTSIGDYAFYNTNLKSLTIGAGVRSIGMSAFSDNFLYSNPIKVIWMTNTPPDGYKNAEGVINYVSNDLYTSLTNKKVYPFLSSMFDVDGVKYVLINPSERSCDAIDCVYDERNTDVDIKPQTTYRTVSLDVKNVQPYIFYGNEFVQNVRVEIGGEISECAFCDCSNMQKAVFGNTNNKDLGGFSGLFIGNNISSIADNAFGGCSKLNNLSIDDREDILALGSNGSLPLFSDCPLDSVYIGGDISYQTSSSKGYSPFYRNTWLRTVVITDKETEVSPYEFYGCSNLQNFTVGDGVTIFGDWSFSGCISLKELSFGTQLREIGTEAFSDCAAVSKIVSKTPVPPVCGTQAMDDISKWDCTLYVPVGSEEEYRSADQWKDFFFVAEGTGEEDDPQEGDKQCATPTITMEDGKLLFECETPGVIYHYQLYMPVTDLNVGNYISVPSAYMVKVYASKEGYIDSAPVTQQIDFSGLKGDMNGDGKVSITDAVRVIDIILERQ